MEQEIVSFFRKNPRMLYLFSAAAAFCAIYSSYYAVRTHLMVERAVTKLQMEISEGLGG